MRFIRLLLAIALVGSLSPSLAEDGELQFKTGDLLASPWNRVAYDATFKKVDGRLYSIRLVFPGQLGITTGYGVMDASFISYCLSGMVAAKETYEGWSQGFEKSSNTKTLGASELNFYLFLLRKGESAQSTGPTHISWSQDVFNDDQAFRDACRKLVKPQMLWWQD